MAVRVSVRRLAPSAAFALAMMGEPSPVFAGSPASVACANAAEEGQKARDEGRLFLARDRFAQCLRPECPGVIAKECAAWLDDVNERIPELIVAVVDGDGRDVTDAILEVDGERSVVAASGRAVSLDPGKHSLRAVRGTLATVEHVVLRERERGRKVLLRLGPEPPPASSGSVPSAAVAGRSVPPALRPVPTLTWVLAGVGGVLAAAGTGFGLSAANSYSDLKSRCPADCTDSDILGLRAKTVTADIAFSLALAAGIGAAIVYMTRPSVVREPVAVGVAGFRF